MDCPQTRSTETEATALLPPHGAAPDVYLDALIHLCGQPQVIVDAGIAAYMSWRERQGECGGR